MSAERRRAGESSAGFGAGASIFLILLGAVSAALLTLGGSVLAAKSQGDAVLEDQVKAVFLYNFTRYLQWPKETENTSFTIVVFGESGIVAPLEEIARRKTVGEKPIIIRRLSEVGEIGRPRILFIAKTAAPEIARILEKTRETDILTVGEAEGLGTQGVAVNFVLREGTVKFEINEGALKEAGIQISSQLLKLAILVDNDMGRDGP